MDQGLRRVTLPCVLELDALFCPGGTTSAYPLASIYNLNRRFASSSLSTCANFSKVSNFRSLVNLFVAFLCFALSAVGPSADPAPRAQIMRVQEATRYYLEFDVSTSGGVITAQKLKHRFSRHATAASRALSISTLQWLGSDWGRGIYPIALSQIQTLGLRVEESDLSRFSQFSPGRPYLQARASTSALLAVRCNVFECNPSMNGKQA